MDLTSKETLQVSKYRDKTPCFLFDSNKFLSVSKSLNEAFSKLPIIIAYSVKTNNAMIILKTILRQKQIRFLEVCSEDEYKKALKAGAKYNQIIYNGVLADVYYRLKIAMNGGLVNVDSYQMYKKLSNFAEKKKTKIKIGVRINIDIGNGYSRFGIIPQSKEFDDFLTDLKSDKYVRLVGFNFHRYGGRDLKGWNKKTSFIYSFLKSLDKDILSKIEYIDFGSNFYGDMDKRLSVQFSDRIISFTKYAAIIKSMLESVFDILPTIIIEPGTPVIANCVSLLAKVDSIKNETAIVDASIFDIGFICKTKNVPFDVISSESNKAVFVKELHGYACTENDIIEKDLNLTMADGDYVLFRNCGAYSYSNDSDFICKRLKLYKI